MGFLRKTFIVSTGGLGRAVVNPNSKKARTAKATEKQLKLQQQALEAEQRRQEAELRAQRDAAQRQLLLEQQTAELGARRQELAIHASHQNAERLDADGGQTTVHSTAPSVADELTKLAELRDRGVLSETEFADQKAKLLAGGPPTTT